jgi:hypothetical protein
MARKVFVPVTLKVDSDGRIRPVDITWTDGHTYEIDKSKGCTAGRCVQGRRHRHPVYHYGSWKRNAYLL